MSKTTVEQKSKLMIAKNKFCDDDFDKLVIETSHCVARKCLDALLGSKQSEQSEIDHQMTTSDSASDINNFDHNNRLNQPKRPMNAFMVWGQAIRRELHHKFSNVQNALLSKALGRVWRSLDPTEKEPFVRKANMIKANHKRDYPNYRYQPRRAQERRARNNMLIGINLNHPVNQLQPQQQAATHLSDQTTTGINHHHHHQLVAHGSMEYPHNHTTISDDNNRKLRNSNSRRCYTLAESRARDLSKDTIDGVQTFEYHPYSTTTEVAIDCNCTPTNSGGVQCQNDMNYREGQHQTSIYPPYQQLSYNLHQQQQHYHQQHLPQQSFSYEVIQQQQQQQHQINHMDNCSGGSPIMNKLGPYYGSSR